MKNKRWLNSITNFDNLYNLLCFSITMTQQTQKMWEISTQHGKQNLFLLSFPTRVKILRVMVLV